MTEVQEHEKKSWWSAKTAQWAAFASEREEQVFLVLTLLIGALVGLAVVAFIVLTERFGARLYPVGATAWRRLLVPAGGSLGMGYLLYRYFPDARGVPQTKAALFAREGKITLSTVFGKFFCTSATLASGIPLGREGPAVQVGGGIASVLGRTLGLRPEKVKALIPVGAAAAIAAAFNTPLAAVLFALEEVVSDLHAPVLGSVVLASATSWGVLRLLLGNEPLFKVPQYQLVNAWEFVVYGILGLAGGLVSVAFTQLLLRLRKWFLEQPRKTVWFQPVAGGLLVGAMGWYVPQVMGVGYKYVGDALNNNLAVKLMVILLVLKLVGTAVSYASGNAGGIFGPSLFLGAMLGGALGGFAHHLFPGYVATPGAYALVGMGTAFAGIIRVPLTSVIMIFEVTRDYSIIVPLMISNLISYFISSRLQETPIYEALLQQDGIHLPPAARDREEPLMVRQACRPATEVVGGAEAVAHAVERLRRDDYAWPVVEDGQLLGMVTFERLESALLMGFGNEPASSLLTEPPADAEAAYVYADDPLDTAMRRMAQQNLKALPVVSRTDKRALRAVLSLRDILAAYGLEGQPQAATPAGHESPTSVRVLVRTLAVLVFAAALAAVAATYYRADRTKRAQRDFADANALAAKDQYDEAIDKYRSAVSVLHSGEYRLALGLALLKAGHLDEAEIYLSEFLQENPNSGPANLGMARVKARQGAIDDAVRAYHRAIFGTWSAGAASQRTDARLELIDLLEKSGRREQARAEVLSLKSVLPADPAVRKRVGHLFLDLGMPAEAVAVFRELLETDQDDAEAEAGLGEAELASNNLLKAQTAFREATRLQPGDAGYKARASLLDEAISMDPALPGLDRAERYRRSRKLLEAALAAFDKCRAAKTGFDASVNENAANAHAALRRSVKARSYREAAEVNTDLAAALWSDRRKLCGAPGPEYEALARVMADVAR
jgi:CIC family chloride channel protein